MKLQWLGHACFAITLSDGRVVVTRDEENSKLFTIYTFD